MWMRRARAGVMMVIALLLGVASLRGQTTSRIVGTITDALGAPMSGVVVTATSPSFQGARSTPSNTNGEYRLLALAPGTYAVKAEIPGFRTVEQRDVVVEIDKTVTLPLKMVPAGVAETIQVNGESSVVDTTSAAAGVSATAELFERIPLQRSFDDVARVAAGTQQDAVGTVFYGSSGAENQYIIEGLNTTGVRWGTLGKSLSLDLVDAVEVKTSGMPAEYGRMTGGAVNVLTKSGSNDFHGSAFGFFEGKGLASQNTTQPDQPATTTSVSKLEDKHDFGASLGGYLVRDKLWFFGAYNRVSQTNDTSVIRTLTQPGSPAIGSVIPATTRTSLYSGKLTWKMTANHTLTASIFGDPNTLDGNVFPINGPASTWQGTRDQGGADYVARYNGVISSSLLIRAQYGRHRETRNFGGDGRDIPLSIDLTVVPTQTSGGFGFFADQVYTRSQARLDISRFWGSHEVKVGGDWQGVDDVANRHSGGAGQIIDKLQTAGGVVYYNHGYFVDDLASGYDSNDPATWQIANPLVTKPSTRDLSAYAQDSWKVTPSLTLNLGLRWESQAVRNRFGETVFKLGKNWAPRVAFAWDVKGNVRSRLYAAYGRYYEDIPQDINVRAFGGEVSCSCYNFSPSPSDTLPDPAAPRRSRVFGGPEPVDPNLRGQFVDEWLMGYEEELAPHFSLGLKATYRDLGRVIEDFLVPSEGNYFIANPGEGTLGQSLAFYDQVHTAPSPKAQRQSLTFEITGRKRLSDNWQLLASYVWQRLEGNYDGTYQNSTGQLDPNINSAFDYADFMVNSHGHLSAERQHQLKLDGSYKFSAGALSGLNVGLSTHWYSGLPLTGYGYAFAYGSWEYSLVPRGSLGRGPSNWEASIHLDYPIRIGSKGTRLDVIADVFNVFNRQAAIELDQRYNLITDGTCAGVQDGLCNGDGGLATTGNSLTPIGQLASPKQTATNPDFLHKGINFTLPRSTRLGLRLTF